MSDMHRENLEAHRRQNGGGGAGAGGGGGAPAAEFSYRDRAKERRQKYGKDGGAPGDEDGGGPKRNQ